MFLVYRNNNSADENCEVAVVLKEKEVGNYYGEVFMTDWEGGDSGSGSGDDSPLPVGVVATVIGVMVLAVGLAFHDDVLVSSASLLPYATAQAERR
ncbi:hypothetical protein [Halococcus saccharolyticus]|uniref:Uncharacterized protein n=1 Tax=Halococcus saccharolyticus DSM 5350 TaxID=1227455 RepID=M0MIH0_9EURY|nr:hypothetical protein [Halococcus saccharolyticus]EMA44250.1 hypothetical protein C449_12008 [Halococcus saccharolyticus DSM 5350]